MLYPLLISNESETLPSYSYSVRVKFGVRYRDGVKVGVKVKIRIEIRVKVRVKIKVEVRVNNRKKIYYG